jgi:hypothetical protein
MTREEMSCEISMFLDEHPISELLDIVACRVADKEYEAESEDKE